MSLITAFTREKIKTNKITQKLFPRPSIDLSSTNFKFAFNIEYGNGSKLDKINEYIKPYFGFYRRKYTDFNLEWNILSENNSFDFCNINDFSWNEDYFKFNGIENYFCPNRFDFNLTGFYDESDFSQIVFKIELCRNSSNSSKCKSIEEIQEKTHGLYINIFIQDNDIDTTNFDNPIVPSLKYMYFGPLDISKHYIEERFLKAVDIFTDESFFFDNYIKKNSFQLESEKNVYINIKEEDDDTILEINISTFDKKDIIKRDYQKIIDVISSLGGISKILIGTGFVLTFKYNQNSEMINIIELGKKNLTKKDDYKINYNKKKMSTVSFNIIEKKFNENFEKIELEGMHHKPKKIEINLKKNNFENSKINVTENWEKNKSNEIFKNFKIVHNVFKKIEEINTQDRALNFTFFEKLYFPSFCKNSQKQSFIRQEINEIEKYLDISFLIKTIKEIEIMKIIFFNKKQLYIFEFLKILNIKDKAIYNLDKKSFEINGIIEIINKFLRKGNFKKNKINKRMINILNSLDLKN